MKMKTFYNIIASFAAVLVLLPGCTKENAADDGDNITGPYFTLTVVAPGNATKAETIPGVTSLNENKVNSVHYFFYKQGVTDEAPAMCGHFSGLSLDGEGATKTWKIPTGPDIIANKLFPTGVRECQVFVVANAPASILEDLEKEDITLSQVRALSFVSELEGTQDNFVMVFDGTGEVSSRIDESAMNVTAKLRRVANKITLTAHVAQAYHDTATGFDWIPKMEGLRVELYNGISKANLSGDFDILDVDKEDYFTSSESSFGEAADAENSYYYSIISQINIPEDAAVQTLAAVPSAPTSESDAYIKVDDVCYQLSNFKDAESVTPFYTYPMKWEFTAANEPYLMFTLPWETTVWSIDPVTNIKTKTSFIQVCYYKMMLSEKSFGSNGWYKIKVDLKVLGSFDKFKPTQQYLYNDYAVLDWINAFAGEVNNVDAEIKDARYLVVNQTEYVLNNQFKLSIPFSSSHPCSFEVIAATRPVFSGLTSSTENFTTAARSWFKINGPVLEFDHSLHNKLDGDMDYAPYDIRVKIMHTDEPANFVEEIHIIQYPAVYIERQLNLATPHNAAGEYVSGGSISGKGYVYVNKTQGTSTNNYNYVGGTYTSGTIKNPYMTIISVSQFPSDLGYIIGDPRSATPTDLSAMMSNVTGDSKSAQAPALSGTSPRNLENYYATREDARNYVAPKLRFVSGYSANGGNRSFENNIIRCATYQEDGYPAGRWRLPTKAEIEYLNVLADEGFIIDLFYANTSYWCSSGYIDGDGKYHEGTAGVTASSRCVYDEWYWSIVDGAPENDPTWRPVKEDTFTWGDQELN